jgi:hypothetical protein
MRSVPFTPDKVLAGPYVGIVLAVSGEEAASRGRFFFVARHASDSGEDRK